MRVCAVAGTLDRTGGAELSFLSILGGLAARRHGVDLVYHHTGSLADAYGAVCESMQAVDLYGRWQVRLTERPAAVYLNLPDFLPFGAELAASLGCALVCRLCVPASTSWEPGLDPLVESVDRFVAVSRATRRGYLAAGLPGQKVDVVPSAVDMDHFTEGDSAAARARLDIPSDAYVVLFVGRLDRDKGAEHLLDAWRVAGLSDDQTALLLLAGGPRLHASVEEAQSYIDALRARATPNCRFLGRRDDIADLYRAADAVVVPSAWEEPLPRSAIEALASGRPAIASAVGGVPEVFTGPLGRFLVPPRDGDALARQLLGLRNWQTREPLLGRLCRDAVKTRFSVDTVTTATERVLAAAVGLRATRPLP